jgi:EmrB/QacA subfamily drug resistance transporter
MSSSRQNEHENVSDPQCGPSRRLIFAIASSALFMSSVDLTIVATALPAIHEGLHATINWAGWIITMYSLGMAVSLPMAGRFSDQFGRKKFFLCCVALFTSASLVCGLSINIYMLIAARALQAFGGGAFQPSAAGIVSDHFGLDRDRALGMFGTIAAGGQITGPILGGIFVSLLSWRWIFFVNVPIGVSLFVAIHRFVPETRRTLRSKIDVRGIVLMATVILLAILGITELGSGRTEIYDPRFLVPEFFAAVLALLMVRHAKRVAEPFIPPRLIRGRGIGAANIINGLWGAVGFGVASLVPLYAEQRYHLSALSSGTLLTARAVGTIAVGTLAALALRRTGYRMPLIVGFLVVAGGMLALSVAPRWGLSPCVAQHRRWNNWSWKWNHQSGL